MGHASLVPWRNDALDNAKKDCILSKHLQNASLCIRQYELSQACRIWLLDTTRIMRPKVGRGCDDLAWLGGAHWHM